MQLGQVVDFVIEYNERQKAAEKAHEKKQKPKKRKATQADIDAWLG